MPWSLVLVRSRVRRFVRRHRVVWWAAVALLAALTAHELHRASAAAEAARTRWGTTVPALVADHPLEPGAAIAPSDVVRTELPAAMVPATAVTELPADATVAHPLVEGEVVLEGHLGGGGVVPPGWRGLAVPAGGAVPDVRPGDAVDLVAWADPLLGGDGTASTVTGGVVVATAEVSLTVAVPAEEVDEAVAALATGTVVVVTRAS